jgi:xanthine dehydrogenase accessory factor
MMLKAHAIGSKLEEGGRAVLIHVSAVRGSAPRETGAGMIVFADGSFTGTIGGGTLEWAALAEAQKLMAAGALSSQVSKALGPELGQCCGGHVTLSLTVFDVQQKQQLGQLFLRSKDDVKLLLFGAGHVGQALVLALAPLPFAIEWIDPRASVFPQFLPQNVTMHVAADPPSHLKNATNGTLVAIMTHSHALDLAIAAAALPDPRFAYVGLIGSATKRARFMGQMKQAGLDVASMNRLLCPIGDKSITGKEPAVIAAGIATQLLSERQKLLQQRGHETGVQHDSR